MDYVGYHGSAGRFEQPADFTKLKSMDFGPGFYFALDPRDARDYGRFVFRAGIRLENPIRIERDFTDEKAMQKIMRALRISEEDLSFATGDRMRYIFELAKTLIETGTLTQLALRKFLLKLGYDGVIVDQHVASEAMGRQVHDGYVVVFAPESILSWELDASVSRNRRSSVRRRGSRRRSSRR